MLRVVCDEDAAVLSREHANVCSRFHCLDWKHASISLHGPNPQQPALRPRAVERSQSLLFVKLRLGTVKLRLARRDLSNGTLVALLLQRVLRLHAALLWLGTPDPSLSRLWRESILSLSGRVSRCAHRL